MHPTNSLAGWPSSHTSRPATGCRRTPQPAITRIVRDASTPSSTSAVITPRYFRFMVEITKSQITNQLLRFGIWNLGFRKLTSPSGSRLSTFHLLFQLRGGWETTILIAIARDFQHDGAVRGHGHFQAGGVRPAEARFHEGWDPIDQVHPVVTGWGSVGPLGLRLIRRQLKRAILFHRASRDGALLETFEVDHVACQLRGRLAVFPYQLAVHGVELPAAAGQ